MGGANRTEADGKVYYPEPNLTSSKGAYYLNLIKMYVDRTSSGPFAYIRKNYAETVHNEWTKENPISVFWGFMGNDRSNKFKVSTQFEFSNDFGDSVPVRLKAKSKSNYSTIMGGGPKYEYTCKDEGQQVSHKYGNKTETVSFTFVKFDIVKYVTTVSGFVKDEILLTCQYKNMGGSWVNMKTVAATVYFMPAKPNLPWKIGTINNQNPWTDALDMLIKWGVEGMTDTKQIASQITKHVNSSIKLNYDVVEGGSSLTTGRGAEYFKCSSFIDSVKTGKAQTVNCTDCATIVSTFANLLGANLYQVCFGKKVLSEGAETFVFTGFFCNTIKAIGFEKKWQYPFPRDKNMNPVDVSDTTNATCGLFAYHEIAFDSGMSHDNKIYDACLKLDKNAIKEGNIRGKELELLPTDMVFATKPTYNNKLSKDDLAYYRELLVVNEIDNLNKAIIVGYGYGENIGNTDGRRGLR